MTSGRSSLTHQRTVRIWAKRPLREQQPRCQALEPVSHLCAGTPVPENRVRMAGGATDVVLQCRRDPGAEGFDNVEDPQAGDRLVGSGAVDRQEPRSAAPTRRAVRAAARLTSGRLRTSPLLVSRRSLLRNERTTSPRRYVVLVRTDTTPGAVPATTLLSGRWGVSRSLAPGATVVPSGVRVEGGRGAQTARAGAPSRPTPGSRHRSWSRLRCSRSSRSW
jgi:hypothetical protein